MIVGDKMRKLGRTTQGLHWAHPFHAIFGGARVVVFRGGKEVWDTKALSVSRHWYTGTKRSTNMGMEDESFLLWG